MTIPLLLEKMLLKMSAPFQRVVSPLARPGRNTQAPLRPMPRRLQRRQSACGGLAQEPGKHCRPQTGPEGAPNPRLACSACPQPSCLCWTVRRQDHLWAVLGLRLPCFLQSPPAVSPLPQRRRARTTRYVALTHWPKRWRQKDSRTALERFVDGQKDVCHMPERIEGAWPRQQREWFVRQSDKAEACLQWPPNCPWASRPVMPTLGECLHGRLARRLKPCVGLRSSCWR